MHVRSTLYFVELIAAGILTAKCLYYCSELRLLRKLPTLYKDRVDTVVGSLTPKIVPLLETLRARHLDGHTGAAVRPEVSKIETMLRELSTYPFESTEDERLDIYKQFVGSDPGDAALLCVLLFIQWINVADFVSTDYWQILGQLVEAAARIRAQSRRDAGLFIRIPGAYASVPSRHRSPQRPGGPSCSISTCYAQCSAGGVALQYPHTAPTGDRCSTFDTEPSRSFTWQEEVQRSKL